MKIVTLVKDTAYFKKGTPMKLVSTHENDEGDGVTWYMIETLEKVNRYVKKYQEMVTQDYITQGGNK